MADKKTSLRDRLSGRASDNKASTKTTATRVTHEKEEAATKVDQKVETAQPSVASPAMPPPVYSVGAGDTVEKRKAAAATTEHDRKEAKAKARREGRQ
jgi:hypothetical protein